MTFTLLDIFLDTHSGSWFVSEVLSRIQKDQTIIKMSYYIQLYQHILAQWLTIQDCKIYSSLSGTSSKMSLNGINLWRLFKKKNLHGLFPTRHLQIFTQIIFVLWFNCTNEGRFIGGN